ncbi:MAG TPA: hypothetical protein VFN48_01005 [Solirubrobacteraceae bacterium]|nr:hypothetical protein [Solirubrobacteraceae bacterium]
MPLMPIGAILVGEILTLVMPVSAVIALGTWYWRFTTRVPETPQVSHLGGDANELTPAPHIPEALPADPAT